MSKRILSTIFFVISALALMAQDPSFSLSAGAAIPLGPEVGEVSGAPYKPGIKVDGLGRFPLGASSFALSGKLGMNLAPLSGADAAGQNLTLLTAQAGPSYSIIQNETVNFSLSALGGGYLGMLEGSMGSQLAVSGRADFNIQFSPAFVLGVGGDYSYYFSSDSSTLAHTWSGLGIGLNLSYKTGAPSSRKSRLEIKDTIIFPIFPVLHGSYNDNKLGEITVLNGESGPIDDLAVTIYIPKYMTGPQTFHTGESMAKGEEKTLPIHGLLDSSILEETEGTQVQAEISVSYEMRGAELALGEDSQAEILYRNALTWDDDRKAASFVTAREPAVMEFAKNTTSSVRNDAHKELDSSLVNAMIVYEALSLYGLKYQVDPNSSYQELSDEGDVLDYLQFPVETLTYRAGDCDDLSVLFTSVLESLAVDTAFITVPGHIYSAVALKMTPEEAQRTFASSRALIYEDDRVWVPIETTMIDGSSFMEAWEAGARQWAQADGQGRIFPVKEAWQVYPAVALNAYRNKQIEIPAAAQLSQVYNREMDKLINQETAAQVEYLEKAIRESRGERRNRMINSLAVLKARYGLFNESIALLEPITSGTQVHAPSAVNMGNIYYRMGNIELAEEYYNRALRVDPNQPKAVLGIMLIQHEKGNTLQVQAAYAELNTLAPSIAERYAYIVEGNAIGNRASEAGQKEKVLWED